MLPYAKICKSMNLTDSKLRAAAVFSHLKTAAARCILKLKSFCSF